MSDIIGDLMNKCAGDVRQALKRTLSISPEPHLPITTAAGASVMGVIAGLLENMAGKRTPGAEPDPECVLLAGLLCARVALCPGDGVAQAYRDLEVLKTAALKTAEGKRS